MKTELIEKYQTLAQRYQSVSDTKKKQLKLFSFARLISFLLIVPLYYYLSSIDSVLAVTATVMALALFLFLVKKFIQTEKQLHFYLQLVKINQDEIRALNRDLKAFDPGKEFIDPHHDYSFDLDLFGTGSIFQFLNRTVTYKGKNQLANLLGQCQRSDTELIQRQTAIQELAEDLDWRQNFMALGSETENKKNENQIEDLIRHKTTLPSVKWLKILQQTLPGITLLLIAASIAGLDSYSLYKWMILAQLITIGFNIKTILKFHQQFENQGELLGRYAAILNLIETKNFTSEYLIRLKNQLSSNGKPASTITVEFGKILNEFDYSKNILVGFILDSVFLWDIRCLLKLYQWQLDHAHDLPQWFEVLAKTDAMVSLANCNYNHPEWATPEVIKSGFTFSAVDIGHPLIDENRCVKNSFQITGDEQIAIITGANMAGKSTFLRTVGVNLMLASLGCKVCASKFIFSPVRIFTNMRTTDNLISDESYFYAELLRLQAMLNMLRNGEILFVIVDEMLKGTNSTDKLNGSKELINQLISLKTHGIVATHDLGLTELAQIYPEAIKNKCFEVSLQHDELKFNYKLTEGVTRTMNATFLMKKMGIIPKN
jgi:hypothetical protein